VFCLAFATLFFFLLLVNSSNLSIALADAVASKILIHRPEGPSLDENKGMDKDKGTTTLTTYMSFLSVLYKFAFTSYNIFPFFHFSFLVSYLLFDIDAIEMG